MSLEVKVYFDPAWRPCQSGFATLRLINSFLKAFIRIDYQLQSGAWLVYNRFMSIPTLKFTDIFLRK